MRTSSIFIAIIACLGCVTAFPLNLTTNVSLNITDGNGTLAWPGGNQTFNSSENQSILQLFNLTVDFPDAVNQSLNLSRGEYRNLTNFTGNLSLACANDTFLVYNETFNITRNIRRGQTIDETTGSCSLHLSHSTWYDAGDTMHQASRYNLLKVLREIREVQDNVPALATPASTPAPLQQEQIDELKPGFWQSFLDHRRAIKMKKVETKTAMNYNNVMLGVLAIVGIALLVVGTAVIVALHTLQAGLYKATDDAATIISDHPALAVAAYAAANGHEDSTVAIAAMLSEISAKGNVQGSFKGSWTTQTENTIVKLDPTCIDTYTYRTVLYNLSSKDFELQVLQATDAGYERAYANKEVQRCENGTCETIQWDASPGYTIYKRNEHTCAYKIVPQERPGEFIPETVTVNSIDLGYQGIGQDS